MNDSDEANLYLPKIFLRLCFSLSPFNLGHLQSNQIVSFTQIVKHLETEFKLSITCFLDFFLKATIIEFAQISKISHV